MPMLAAVQTSSDNVSAASASAIVAVRVAGTPTPALLLDLKERIAAQRATGVTLSLDLRDVSSIDASADVVRDLAANLGDLVASGLKRVAIISGERRFSLGIARMLQAYAESHGVEAWCFIDAGDAAYWLSAGSTAA